MNYKYENSIESVRVDYIMYYEVYDEADIKNLYHFSNCLKQHMASNINKVFQTQTCNGDSLIINTSKIVNVKISYK